MPANGPLLILTEHPPPIIGSSAVTQWRQLAVQQGLLMPGWQAVRSSQRAAGVAGAAETGPRAPCSAMQRRSGDSAAAAHPMRRSAPVLEPLLPRSTSVPSFSAELLGGGRSLRAAALPEPAQPHECGTSSCWELGGARALA